ncbi:hypothetical protein ES708_11311 [subsurface metagenome]
MSFVLLLLSNLPRARFKSFSDHFGTSESFVLFPFSSTNPRTCFIWITFKRRSAVSAKWLPVKPEIPIAIAVIKLVKNKNIFNWGSPFKNQRKDANTIPNAVRIPSKKFMAK